MEERAESVEAAGDLDTAKSDVKSKFICRAGIWSSNGVVLRLLEDDVRLHGVASETAGGTELRGDVVKVGIPFSPSMIDSAFRLCSLLLSHPFRLCILKVEAGLRLHVRS